MQTWIDLPFADGIYTFKLGIGQIAEIEQKCGAGIGAIYARCLKGRWGLGDDEILPDQAEYRFADLIEVIRQGLIGGGSALIDAAAVKVPASRVTQLIDRYLVGVGPDRMVVKQAWALATAVLTALIEGYAPPGEAGPADAPATPTSGSTSPEPSSTAP